MSTPVYARPMQFKKAILIAIHKALHATLAADLHERTDHHDALWVAYRRISAELVRLQVGISILQRPSLNGEYHGSAKLTNAQAEEIRAMSAGGISRYVLAEIYGVSTTAIDNCAKGRRKNMVQAPEEPLLPRTVNTAYSVTCDLCGATFCGRSSGLKIHRNSKRCVARQAMNEEVRTK